MKISRIVIGERHRKDYGDIDGLAESIKQVGLLHPVVVRSDGRLIAGERRLRAFSALGHDDVPVTIVDLEQLSLGEHAENTQRKDFTLSEGVAVAEALIEYERDRAAKRKIEGASKGGKAGGKGRANSHRGTSPKADKGGGRAADKVAKATGRDRKTLAKATAIVEAAKDEPEKFGKLVEDMDRTGRVDGPFKRMKVMKQAEAIRNETPALPGNGPYRVIVADPPWPYELRKEDPSHRATHPYPQMSIAQICALDVPSLAHEDCILWLWTTNHHMREAFMVLDAWGFAHKTILTWAKDRMGTGDWLRGQTEHALLAVRGKPVVELTNQTTLLLGPLRANSQKPEEFYPFVERLCPAPRYAELFSRHHRDNWDGHGDEHGI